MNFKVDLTGSEIWYGSSLHPHHLLSFAKSGLVVHTLKTFDNCNLICIFWMAFLQVLINDKPVKLFTDQFNILSKQ